MLKDLCVCEVLDKEETKRIRIYTTKKKFRKLVTVVEGIEKNNLSSTAKELKHKLACGGSAKDDVIVLQGNHKKSIKDILVKIGYTADSITVE